MRRPPGLSRAGDVVEQGELGGGEFAHIFQRGRPAGVRRLRCQVPTPLHGASIRMPSNLCLGRQALGGTVPQGGAIVEQLSARAARRLSVSMRLFGMAGPSPKRCAFVFHLVGEVERLAAFAGTGIPPRLARLRARSRDSDQLGSEILDFEFART